MPKGTLIIRAAEQIGVQIPRFCDHPLLDPVGACRQCLVEVEGAAQAGRLLHDHRSPTAWSCKTQLTSAVGGQGAAGHHGVAADQPPAGLPDLRQGRRVPAAEPGDEQRPRRDPVRRRQAHLPEAARRSPRRSCSTASAACSAPAAPGSPSRSPATRSSSCSSAARWSRSPSTRTSRSSPTSPATPSRSARSARSPAPTYRFRARPFDLRSEPSVCEHCASGCAQRTDYRRGKVMRRLAGEDPAVNEEWNCDKGRYAFRYATVNERLTDAAGPRERTASCSRPRGPRRWAAAAEGLRGRPRRPAASACCPAAGSPSRTPTPTPSSPASRWAPTTSTPAPARTRPRSSPSSPPQVAGTGPGAARSPTASWTTAPAVLLVGFEPEEESPIVFLRLRQAVRTRGLPVFDLAPFATRAAEKLRPRCWPRCPAPRPGRCAALARARRRPGAARPSRRCGSPAPSSSPASGWPRCPARFSALLAGWPGATGARVAWVPRRAGERGAVEAGALPTLLPGGRLRRRRRRPRRRRPALGRGARRLPATPGRDPTGILTAARDGELGGLLVGGVDPTDLPDPALRRGGAGRGRLRGQPGDVPQSAVTDAGRRRPAGRRRAGEGRHATSTGRAGRARSTRPCTAPGPAARRPGAAGRWPTRWTSTCGCPPSRRPAPSSPRWAPPAGPRRRRGPGRRARPPARRRGRATRRCSPPGGSCSTRGTLQRDEPRPGRHRPAAGRPARRRRRRRGSGVADGDRLTVSGALAADHAAGPAHRDARPGGLAADESPGQRGPAPTLGARRPARVVRPPCTRRGAA